MATLIICPACDTRYETKAVVPEADEWQARDYALGDFTLEPGRTGKVMLRIGSR